MASGSALIQMPTGTGKTGVISVVAEECLRSKPALVLSPSKALTQQLKTQIGSGFWRKLDARTQFSLPTRTLLPNSDSAGELVRWLESPDREPAVVCGTIQALTQLRRDNPKAFALLRARLGVVVFDEGHREPAQKWAEAVRELECPTILFTATPFRNDLKMFNVNQEHMLFLSFADAVKRRIIRDVELQTVPGSDVDQFVDSLLKLRAAKIQEGLFEATVKVIVRGEDASTVRELRDALVARLGGRQDQVLAVHHTFDDKANNLFGQVPDGLMDRSELFLVHQFMLTEGIDDPNCAILGLYSPFSTDRQLVQQVGRIIRHPNPTHEDAPKGLLVIPQASSAGRMWERYRKFDDWCAAAGNPPPLRSTAEAAKLMLMTMSEMEYLHGRFRQRATFVAAGLDEDLHFPMACKAYRIGQKFDRSVFLAGIRNLLMEDDRAVMTSGSVPGEPCWTFGSVKISTSPYLDEWAFPDMSFEVTIAAIHGTHLFFFDSAGVYPATSPDVLIAVQPDSLRQLLPEGADTPVRMLALRNSDASPHALRGRQLSAVSIAVAAPFMGDHMNVVTRAAGHVSGALRYVSFERGRIRQSDSRFGRASEWYRWTATVATELTQTGAAAKLFDRFASPAVAPDDPTPLNVLFDLREFTDTFSERPGQTGLKVDDACVSTDLTSPPTADGHRFEIVINDVARVGWIKWDPEEEEYLITSKDLARIRDAGNRRVSMLRRINQTQPFRIVTADPGIVYAYGHFYSTAARLGGRHGPARAILDLIEPIGALASAGSEKGRYTATGAISGWDPGSVFGLIETNLVVGRRPGLFGDRFDVVVCDDLNDEVADFIGIDSERLVFVHAKASEKRKLYGASGLQEVFSQAVKNLAYLKADAQEMPKNTGKWGRDWSYTVPKTSIRVQTPRIRCGASTAKEVRDRIRDIRFRPATRRQVWIVLGNSLSKAAVEKQFSKSTPDAEANQVYHLALSLYSACQSVGVELKIFCGP